MNWEPPVVPVGFWRGRGTRDQIANIPWILEIAREFQKNYSCFIDYVKTFNCVDDNKMWKILKEMGITDHLIHLLRNLYEGQEATVRNSYGTTDWFQIGKWAWQGCLLSPVYLISIQSTLCEMPAWMNHKLESRLLGEIPTISDTKMKPQYFSTWWEEPTHWKRLWCWERLKAKGEREAKNELVR